MPTPSPDRSAPPSQTLAAALHLADHGYHVTPVEPRSKAARLSDWQSQILSPADVRRLFRPGDNVGLLLGTEVADGRFLFAVDIDQDDPVLTNRVRLALGGDPPAKRGIKGITYFASQGTAPATRRLYRIDPTTKKRTTAIDFLGKLSQTVIPPSIHPVSGQPYSWVGRSLADTDPSSLPFCDVTAFDEIDCAVRNPDSPLFLINDMAWLGPNRGGSVDSSLLAATAAMVGRGWSDEAIIQRCDAAVALVRDDAEGWDDGVYRKRLEAMIADARKKGFDKGGKRRRPSRQEMRTAAAESLAQELGGLDFLWRDGTVLRQYRNGHWPEVNPEKLLYMAYNLDRSWVQPEDARSIVDLVRGWAPLHSERESADAVCFRNGTYHFRDQEFREWNHDDFLTAQLDFDYVAPGDRMMACPAYDDLLLSVFHMERTNPEDARTDDQLVDDMRRAIAVFEEFAAYTLVNDISLHKMLVIRGPTRSGKTTLANFLMRMHDRQAVSSVPINRMHEERYLSALDGKLLNVSAEVNADAYVDDSVIKNITGGDRIEVRRLYEEPVSVVLPTRLMICCNRMFRTRDTSGAIEQRMLYLDCGRTLDDGERNPDMMKALMDERAAIFNRWARAYANLRARGRFAPPGSTAKYLSEFTQANNHVLNWMQERTHQGLRQVHPEHRIPDGDRGWTDSQALYEDYVFWVEQNGFKQMNRVSWGSALVELRYPSFNKKLPGSNVVVKARRLTLAKPTTGRDF